jgi:hypothetical protein
VRAQKLFVETFLGRPREAAVGAEDRTIELLLAFARQTRPSEVVIDAPSRPLARRAD